MVEINIETIAKPAAYSDPQIRLAIRVAQVLHATVDGFDRFLLLEPPENH